MLLFRKIEESRWFDRGLLESASVTELDTSDNELSVWMQKDDVADIDLGLAFILTQRCFKTICCVKIPDERLEKVNLTTRQQDGDTAYLAMRPYHTNIVVPTVKELSLLSEIIYELVHDKENNCRFFSETELKMHFYEVLQKDAITIDFNAKTNQAKWDALQSVQKTLGKIDFTKLKNAVPREDKKK